MAKVPGWIKRIFGAASTAAVEAAAGEVVKGAAKVGVDVTVEGLGKTVTCPNCGTVITFDAPA